MFVTRSFKNAGLILIFSTIFVAIYFPARHARRYQCTESEEILSNLRKTGKFRDNLSGCNYRKLLENPNSEVAVEFVASPGNFSQPKLGGKFVSSCRNSFKSAIIVPYRNRKEHLEIFINYMHSFLQKQLISYQIFLVDQNNKKAFNRAKLLNLGAKVAMKKGFECLILHDVDLIPLNYKNIYACSDKPRHMSSSLDTFRYNLPYLTLFGGAVAILSEQYKKINGMSNLFEGWGGEDDDLYKRLEENGLSPFRFCPEISRYTMLNHKKNHQRSENRFELLKDENKRHFDGLNNLNESFVVELKPLYTHIVVL